MLARFPLRQLFLAVCAVFAAPILLLAALYYDGQQHDIAFSSKERDGVAYLQALWPAIGEVAIGQKPRLDDVVAVGDRHNSSVAVWPQWRAFRLAVEQNSPPAATAALGHDLIRAVGDGSNLILDPDLDSYYLMEAVVIRLPALAVDLTELREQAGKVAAAGSARAAKQGEHEALRALATTLVRDRRHIETGFESVFSHSRDAAMLRPIESALQAALGAIDRVSAATDALLAKPQARGAFEAVEAAHAAVIVALDPLYQASTAQLDALLKRRIDRLYDALWMNLAFVSVVTLAAIGMAIMIASRIVRVFTELAQRLHALSRGNVEIDIPYMSHSNEIGLIARSLQVFRDHALERLQLAEDIAESHRRREQDLERVAYYDDLTGLPNRKHLYRAFNAFLAERGQGVRGAILYLDLDRFKEVNDTLGHQAGDELIRTASQRLLALVRPGDVVARISGDEFALLLGDVDEPELVQHFGSRLLARLAEPYEISGGILHLTASVGVSLISPNPAHDADELLRRADVALYRAKQRGRNCCVLFDSVFDADVLYRKRIESALREAIETDQVKLAFQPQFDAESERIVGVEALARWTDPKLGVVSPSMFISIAEHSGLIVDLGRSILRQAMMHARRWPDLTVAINISVLQLRQKAFLEMLAHTALDSGVEPSRIELELTESILLEDVDDVNETLRQVKAMGYRLALDDFGTGYSSLSYLTRFAFDKLKIDRSFVQNLQDSPHARTVMRSIAALGRAVGLEVCAEGVETEAQLDVVRDIGCTSVQGYLFMPAAPADEIDALIKDGGQLPARKLVGGRRAAG